MYYRTPIDRRSPRAQQLVAMVMEILKGRLPDEEYGRVAMELMNLFWGQGVQLITDADRTLAGLPMRNHHGMTLEELAIIEHRTIERMLKLNEYVTTNILDGTPGVGIDALLRQGVGNKPPGDAGQ